MATLFMMMGLPGSGKTTIARQLEAERPALLLSPDVWMSQIVGDGYDAKRREAIKAIQLEIAQRVLTLGKDVILEFGFFSRAERDAVRAIATAVGAAPVLIFLDPPFEELVRRIEKRNADLPPDTFRVSREHLELCGTWLERPGSDEIAFQPEIQSERFTADPASPRASASPSAENATCADRKTKLTGGLPRAAIRRDR